MKVLISAYACEPGKGSEPGTGWEWSRAAALEHEVWVLTRKNNAAAIEAALNEDPALRLRPVYIDLPKWARWWKHGQRGVHLYYLLWQLLAWRWGRKLHNSVGFDVAHHVTFAVDWMPAGVGWIRNLPLVWGPVGGATSTPWRMWRWLGWRGILSEALRELSARLMRRVFADPVARRAAVVVAQNREVARRFRGASEVVMEPHVAIRPPADAQHHRASRGARRRAVFVGRLIPWKGLLVAIEAIAMAPDWELHIYGSGPDRARGERYVRRLGLESRVRFHGRSSRAVVLSALKGADILLHPAMHDSAPWAVAEATSLGCLVCSLDRGGPPVISEPFGGVVVPADEHAAENIARVLVDLPVKPALDQVRTSEPRWGISRLPELVTDWYRRAVGLR